MLTSTTVSARAIADWFVDGANARYRNDECPLGSVAILLSEAEADGGTGLASYAGGEVPRATFKEVAEAVKAWVRRINTNKDNLAILYVTSHGESFRNQTAFLLEDYGLDDLDKTSGMSKIEQLAGALENATPIAQLLLFDCCRVPTGMRLPWDEELGTKLISLSRSEDDHGEPRKQWVIAATSLGEVATGRTNKTTLFADALINALDGVASDPAEDGWPVRPGTLVDKIDSLLALHRRQDERAQTPGGKMAGSFDITFAGEKQQVPVFVSFKDPAEWPDSVITVTADPGKGATIQGEESESPYRMMTVPILADVQATAVRNGEAAGSAKRRAYAPAIFLELRKAPQAAGTVIGQLDVGRSLITRGELVIALNSTVQIVAGGVADIIWRGEAKKPVKQLTVPIGGEASLEVQDGDYTIVLRTPDGHTQTKDVKLAKDVILRVEFSMQTSPQEWLAPAIVSGAMGGVSAVLTLAHGKETEALESLFPTETATQSAPEFAPVAANVFSHVEINLLKRRVVEPRLEMANGGDDGRVMRLGIQDNVQVRFKSGGRWAEDRPLFALIKVAKRQEFAVIPSLGFDGLYSKGGWNPYLIVDRAASSEAMLSTVIVEDRIWGGLLGFIASRDMITADKLLDSGLTDKAVDAMSGKRTNPLAALAGALVAVATSSTDVEKRWDPWLRNLANWFPGIPDGPIILGRRLLVRARNAEEIAEAKKWLFEGFDRGVPIYSLSVEWLARGLESIAGEDAELAGRRKAARQLANRVDPARAFTVIRLDDEEKILPTFKLAMHPASEGDALMLTWGKDTLHHALVDVGRTGDYRALKPLLEKIGSFELFTISHIDADHIEGAVPLFQEETLPIKAKNVWFNAHAQLVDAKIRSAPLDREFLGAAQAEKVTAGIVTSKWPWNAQFASGIVSLDSPEAGAPLTFEGGLKLTILSPSDMKLSQLLPVWDAELEKAGLRTVDPDELTAALVEGREHLGSLNVDDLAARKFAIDTTKPNGTSITFVAEFGGKRVLMGADSHPDIVEASLRKLGASETDRYRLDCLKVSHHGSRANTSPSLLNIIDCTRFAFSTDGSRHGHPHAETIARILKADPERKKTLIFNFRQNSTNQWDDAELKKCWNYECLFPEAGKTGLEFDI
ncbi:caspase family protein [Mesorhizobium sp. M0047]